MWKQYFLSYEWALWAWLGMALILGGMWFSVQIDVRINEWLRLFWNLVTKAIAHPGDVQNDEIYAQCLAFAKIAGVGMLAAVLLDFFTSHWTLRWRQALTEDYVRNWPQLRTVEGASQRIQEDTMNWSKTIEVLGETLVQSILKLIAFLPILSKQSEDVTELPLIGHVNNSLVWASLAWSIVGTLLLAGVGVRLPGLEFQNQRVEAAYRKELVLGEDDSSRASEAECRNLFGDIRTNYFNIFLNYLYFNVAKYSYLQFDVVFPILLLTPSISAGAMDMGEIQQIMSAFSSVGGSFQFLVKSWSTIVNLISIYKRLKAFEAILDKDGDSASEGLTSENEMEGFPGL